MIRERLFAGVFWAILLGSVTADFLPVPDVDRYAAYDMVEAEAPEGSLLQKGDRVAICGDSITEQKMYSVLMEVYLRTALPELGLGVRQYGWSGERATGFLRRMEQDVLRFSPTVATTCYGMNDHRYMEYTEEIGTEYRETSRAILRKFKEAGVRAVQGSSGTIGKWPKWVKGAGGTVEAMNLSLCRLRNIGVEVAKEEGVRFADVYYPMLMGSDAARRQWGADFDLFGDDGVHPGWAGQGVMAYAFLKALGVDGEIGTLTVDFGKGKATASDGHRVVGFADGKLELESVRYPVCIEGGDVSRDDNLRATMAVVPFNEELNRLTLVVSGGSAREYEVKWGERTVRMQSEDLARGVNLAATFQDGNPFSGSYKKVWDAVREKQAFETVQVKKRFHGEDGKADIEAVVKETEKRRDELVAGIKAVLVPVTHSIEIREVK